MKHYRNAKVVRYGNAAPLGKRATATAHAEVMTPDLSAAARVLVTIDAGTPVQLVASMRAQDVQLLADTLAALAREMRAA